MATEVLANHTESARRSWMRRLGPQNLGAVYAWILLIVVFGLISPNNFLTATTLKQVLNQYSITALAGLALVLPLSAGLFDLSIGSTAALAGIGSAWWLAHVSVSPVMAVLFGIVVALGCGLINAFVVVGLGVDSFIGTLATSSIYTAATVAISGDEPISQNVNGAFSNDIALKNIGGITLPVVYMIVVMVILAFFLEKTIFGRRTYAVGFDLETARLGGVPVKAIQVVTLTVCAGIAGIAGIVETATIGAGDPSIASYYLLPAFTAAFLGATQFRHGRFNPWGAVVATLLIGTGDVGLLIVGAAAWTQDVFQGAVLIIAVSITSARGFGPLSGLVGRMRRRGSPPTPPDTPAQVSRAGGGGSS
jgi:ribose transport system permease protein